MLSVDEARVHVLERVAALPKVDKTLESAWGFPTAQDIVAAAPLPRFDNSAMDGFAVRSEDVALATLSDPVRLAIAGEVRAGAGIADPLGPGRAIRIATGAAVPEGADSVVPIEVVEETGGKVAVVQPARAGQHIRRAGEDLQPGDLAIPQGTRLMAGELALLAALGETAVRVRRAPRVAVLVTGDELVSPGEVAGVGQIYDSNSIALDVLLQEAGAEITLMSRVGDTAASTESALENARSGCDMVLCCGGVSVGPYDLVKEAVARAGRVDHWRVAMQPGKPLVIGDVGGTPFLGLPGNPVSVHVTFEQFVRPALRKMQGYKALLRPRIEARLTRTVPSRSGRRRFIRVRLTNDGAGWEATPTGGQGSHIQSSLVDCHGLAIVPEDQDRSEAGMLLTVEVWRLPER